MARHALRPRQDPAPSPYTVPNTGQWDGNDGQWSTFRLSVGTPPQDFRVLVSTRGHETWVPVPEGCTASDPSDCASERGTDTFRGQASAGFQTNQSSTWEEIGIYDLGLEASLGYTGNGLYGYDTIRLGSSQDSSALAMDHQVVAGIAVKDYFMGVIGVSPTSSSFDSASEPVGSLFNNLAENKSIPSRSYAYTAGAYYRNKKVPGSLILGGYDQARFASPPRFNFTFSAGDTSNLVVGVQSITASNSLIGVSAMTTTGHLSLVDSTVPHLWLPDDVCDLFEQNFGLTYDEEKNFYLVNDTIHQKLLSLNPEFTFKLGNEIYTSDTNSTNIVLPYAAFDLEISYPYYENTTRYFPIRKAANDTQYTLGRALLQEAYLVVDHERRNFTITQAKFSDPLPTPDIVSILSPGSEDPGDSVGGAAGLSTGATAGIAVAASVVGVFLIVALIFCWRRKHRRKPDIREAAAWEQPENKPPYDAWRPAPIESDNNEIAEMGGHRDQDKDRAQELGAGRDVAYELASAHVPMVYEMDGNNTAKPDVRNDKNNNRFSWQ
ncbi:putative peptidase aspartic protein [Neofusicoccum parvum UCRNP2]|uniref:Peptidase A1 n=2 Tax=Neofusicoccum parvum TaxID=310453 RepID=A0ACB5SER2_9PEZI|nr:putative peptidase aspartic protein [Neofusicoccum parvum UCRNP2]GME37520.1 Peptidase A1 [Neofusicoccum parvum]